MKIRWNTDECGFLEYFWYHDKIEIKLLDKFSKVGECFVPILFVVEYS